MNIIILIGEIHNSCGMMVKWLMALRKYRFFFIIFNIWNRTCVIRVKRAKNTISVVGTSFGIFKKRLQCIFEIGTYLGGTHNGCISSFVKKRSNLKEKSCKCGSKKDEGGGTFGSLESHKNYITRTSARKWNFGPVFWHSFGLVTS